MPGVSVLISFTGKFKRASPEKKKTSPNLFLHESRDLLFTRTLQESQRTKYLDDTTLYAHTLPLAHSSSPPVSTEEGPAHRYRTRR